MATPLPDEPTGRAAILAEPPPPKKRNARRFFVTGLVVVIPLAITVWFLRFAAGKLEVTVTPILRAVLRALGVRFINQPWMEWLVPLVSLTVLLLFIYLVGLVASNVMGRQLIALMERMIRSIPVVSGIYTTSRQFMDTFAEDSRSFSKVVLVEYPRRGLWTMALLTNETEGEVQHRTEDKLVSVFVPTTPNPTSGWLLFVPQDEIVELEMSVDDAFKMIISGGVLTPPYEPKADSESE